MPRKHYPSDDESEVDVKSDDETLEAAPPKEEQNEIVEATEPNLIDEIPDIVKAKRPRGRPKVVKVKEGEAEKPKKRLSEKQLAALAAGRAKRTAAKEAKSQEKEAVALEKKKVKDKKVVKKAKEIAKREIMEEAALELSSDDELDDIEVKHVKKIVAKRKAAKKTAAKPRKTRAASSPPAEPEAPAFVFM